MNFTLTNYIHYNMPQDVNGLFRQDLQDNRTGSFLVLYCICFISF